MWETYFLTVGFCASGLSVVVIAMDRYLLMCHGYFASWSKTGILLLICWFIGLVFPAFVIFPTLPNSIMLANGFVCFPNFTSKDSLIHGLLLMALLMILLTKLIVVFCYGNVFYKYNSILLRKQKRNDKAVLALPEQSKKLLYRLCFLTGNYFFTFIPISVTFAVMMGSKAEINDNAALIVITIFEIGLLLNPILIYLLDAKMKLSVNEMFDFKPKTGVDKRLDQIKLKETPAPIPAPTALIPERTDPILQDTDIEDTQKIRFDIR